MSNFDQINGMIRNFHGKKFLKADGSGNPGQTPERRGMTARLSFRLQRSGMLLKKKEKR